MSVIVKFKWLAGKNQQSFFSSEIYRLALQNYCTFHFDESEDCIVGEPDEEYSRECINCLAFLKTEGYIQVIEIKKEHRKKE